MNICLIGPSYPFRGGISHYMTLLYRHLRVRHDVQFFSFKRQYPEWLFLGKTDIDPSNFPIKEEHTDRIIDSLNPVTWLQAASKIIKSHPDLVIIPWWVSFWAPQFYLISLLVKLLSKARIFFICHNVVAHESKWIDKFLTHTVLRNGDFFIVHSQNDKNNLLKILPLAIVSKTFHPTYACFNLFDNNSQEIRRQFSIKGKILIFFGFVREYKGLKYLLEAIPEVLLKMPITLLVVGEFWNDKKQYLNIVEKLKIGSNVIFVDKYIPNEEVGKYFNIADLVVQPYVSATGSGVIQIAFGFHKPVIATRVGCLPEVVVDGKTGYLVPPRSSSEIASAIIDFFHNKKAKEFSENIKAENYKFSWDRLIDVIEKIAR